MSDGVVQGLEDMLPRDRRAHMLDAALEAQGAIGATYAPLQSEFKYIRNGQYVTETHILPSGSGKIAVESSPGEETVWGQVQYRVKSLGGLPTAVRELVNDGLTSQPPSE